MPISVFSLFYQAPYTIIFLNIKNKEICVPTSPVSADKKIERTKNTMVYKRTTWELEDFLKISS